MVWGFFKIQHSKEFREYLHKTWDMGLIILIGEPKNWLYQDG
jgi:hypothetical protein